MNGINKKIWFMVLAVVLLLAIFSDITGGKVDKNGVLQRSEYIEDEYKVNLELDAEGVLEDYEYLLIMKPRCVTKEEAEQLFWEVKQEIDAAFVNYEKLLPIQESYLSGQVEVDWSYTPSGYIDSDGKVVQENVPKEGILIVVQANLSCGNYEQVYTFPIQLEKAVLTEKEAFLTELASFFDRQMQQEGTTKVTLPDEINGVTLSWKEKRESVSIRVLGLAVLAMVFICYLGKKEEKDQEETRRKQMEYQYSEVVSQLAMLLEAGMTMRQAWQCIAKQYQEKRNKGIMGESLVYEAIVRMGRRISEGEKERLVYEAFIEETNVSCYRRLMRTLIGNMEKGMNGVCDYLEEEERRAYTERILLAKKLGEEASTKMLIPLMLMMMLVMGVVLAPAMIGFLN
ncbi:MAG: type II secretion system F family protein [Agathobacter sp.]|nr:type II secretion system F family protein [Agathobacter sp.]